MKSPYLSSSGRLADVIAAIQVLATYKFYKLDFAGWERRITGGTREPAHWRRIFEQHPEFFRLNQEQTGASLVIRRAHQKLYDVDRETVISRSEYQALNADQKRRISRAPLSPDEIATLIRTATDLHARALEDQKASRWWLPVLTAGIAAASGIAGAIVGATLKGGG